MNAFASSANLQSAMDSGGVYTDLAGLQGLRAKGREDKEAALEEIARQFESLLISQMLKSMRDANQVFAEGNPLSSNEEQLYRDMFDQQISLSLGSERGIGIAEAMVRQLKRSYVNSESPAQDESIATVMANPIARPASKAREMDLSTVPQATHAPVAFDGDPEAFVQALYPLAEEAGQRLGVAPEVLLAQAALETGWGAKMLSHRDGRSSFNLFNIKADSRWSGQAVTTQTLEYRDGLAIREQSRFRAYESLEQSFDDYANFVETSPRYRGALSQASDSERFVRGLAEAGYATDPAYADKVIGILNNGRLRSAVAQVAGE